MIERGEYGYQFFPEIGSTLEFSNTYTESFTAEESINFGVPVKRGASREHGCAFWEGGVNVPVLGITRSSHGETSGRYEDKTMVSVLRRGKIVVLASVEVEAGQEAYLVHDTGHFTNVPDANRKIGVFTTDALANSPVVLEIDLIGS